MTGIELKYKITVFINIWGGRNVSKNKEVTMREVIEYVANLYKEKGMSGFYADESWSLYSADYEIGLDTICVIEDPVDIDDDDNEILPESIVERNMVFIWSDELLQDTISSAIDQKADASPELILEAINYYDINDDFMTIK